MKPKEKHLLELKARRKVVEAPERAVAAGEHASCEASCAVLRPLWAVEGRRQSRVHATFVAGSSRGLNNGKRRVALAAIGPDVSKEKMPACDPQASVPRRERNRTRLD